jgi:MerR family transcriptional regulator/heat shock protein HspR
MSGQRFLDPEEFVDDAVVGAPDDAAGDAEPSAGAVADEVAREAAPTRQRPRGAFGQRGPDYDEPVYVISVAADLADLHPQTLRAYEREGLLQPHRTGGNTRRYSQRDIDRLRFIRHLTTEEGLNLAGVRVVLDLGEKLESSRARVRELEEMVRTLAERLQTDVDAAHRSHRFEVVPAGRRDMEPHPTMRRRPAARRG